MIDLEKVRVTFGDTKSRVTALAETSLRIAHGEFVALVGPSSCGKSTILKLVAGTLTASQGNVFVAGREIGANEVRIEIAFQNPTLLPWLNIRDNVMLPLKIVPPFKQAFAQKRKLDYRYRVEASLAQVGLPGTMPYFFASLKVAATLAIVGTVISETVASNRGIGNLVMIASSSFDVPLVFAGLFIMAALGVGLYVVFSLIESCGTGSAVRSDNFAAGG